MFVSLAVFTSLADEPSPFTSPASAGTNSGPSRLDSIMAGLTNDIPLEMSTEIKPLDDKYKLAIGDRLSFKIVEDGEDSKQYQITDSGDIDFPYIGRFPAVDKTCRELADQLKSELEKEYYRQATVIVAVDFKARSQGKIYLIGAVGSPGPQDIPSDEEFTLSKAILRGGGFTDFADQHHVKITRKQSGQSATANQTIIVDVAKIFKNGKTDLDVVVEAGDMILIPEKWIRF